MDIVRGNPPDVRWKPAGTGHGMSFKCAACVKPKPILGRKLQRVDGVRQFVCKGCAR